MTPNRIIAIVIILILLVIAPTIKHDLLGAQYVTLSSASALSGAVSQSLGGASGSSPLPVEGKDYTLSLQYFDNNTWAVGLIKPLNNSFNASTVVLQKQQGTFQAVVGPASAAPSTLLQSLPTNVADYTRAHMAVYQPVPDEN
jgi:hypothetical protein